MAEYIHEFLWRGFPPGSDEPFSFHVQLGDTDRPGIIQTLGMAAAIERGFTLQLLGSTLSLETLQAVDAQRAELGTLRTQLNDAVGATHALAAALEQERLRANREAADATTLRAALDEAHKQLAATPATPAEPAE